MRGTSLVLLGLLVGCGAAEAPPVAPKPVAKAPAAHKNLRRASARKALSFAKT